MKKLLALALVAGTTATMATACGGKGATLNVGEAIAVVHSGTTTGDALVGYMGLATVATKGDKIEMVTINETINKFGAKADATKKVSVALTKIEDVKTQLASTTYEYSFKTYAFAADTCIKLSFNGLLATGIAANDQAACTTASGTWYAANATWSPTKTGSGVDGVDASGATIKSSTSSAAAVGMTETSGAVKKGLDSKRASQGTEYGYWDPTNRSGSINGWSWNMSQIENFFVGKTWNDIKDLDLTKAATITGATASDRHQYANMIREAAKVAFGK